MSKKVISHNWCWWVNINGKWHRKHNMPEFKHNLPNSIRNLTLTWRTYSRENIHYRCVDIHHDTPALPEIVVSSYKIQICFYKNGEIAKC